MLKSVDKENNSTELKITPKSFRYGTVSVVSNKPTQLIELRNGLWNFVRHNNGTLAYDILNKDYKYPVLMSEQSMKDFKEGQLVIGSYTSYLDLFNFLNFPDFFNPRILKVVQDLFMTEKYIRQNENGETLITMPFDVKVNNNGIFSLDAFKRSKVQLNIQNILKIRNNGLSFKIQKIEKYNKNLEEEIVKIKKLAK